MQHNELAHYTQITEVGAAGSGRTTALQSILHEIHKLHPYIIHYIGNQSIASFKRFANRLQKHEDHVLVMDASFSTEKAVEELLPRLMLLRHITKGRAIIIFVMFYSYSLAKALRQSDVSILTSVSDFECEYLSKFLSQENMSTIKEFRGHLASRDGNVLVSTFGSRMLYMKFRKLEEQCAECSTDRDITRSETCDD